jgi:hypothetical protein
LPPLYSQESTSVPIVLAKLFTPDAGWTWYIKEEDGDWLLFGYVIRPGGGVGVFLALRNCGHPRPAPASCGARSRVSAGPDQ